jgi:hypothetical protein
VQTSVTIDWLLGREQIAAALRRRVTAAVIGYALGLGMTIVPFLQWWKRR